MKLITAIIQPHQLDQVRDALTGRGFHGMTVTDVKGYGRQRGRTEFYRGTEYEVAYLPKTKIEIAVDDLRLEEAMEAIVQSARTGRIGDGKIFVSEILEALRIRTGETGPDAL